MMGEFLGCILEIFFGEWVDNVISKIMRKLTGKCNKFFRVLINVAAVILFLGIMFGIFILIDFVSTGQWFV